ncbi:hypothetical protein N6H14_31530 [Paenibacillus sp. CC-CFT747]|nr:hypothetical protein N6H14_31530 [Paenibacillus sp. CC-CFT747]
MDQPTDISLIQRLAQGDRTAFSSLYDRYGLSLYRLSERLALETEEREEIIAAVFLRIEQHASAYQPDRTSVGEWMLLHWKHCACAHLNNRRRERAAVQSSGKQNPYLMVYG